MRPAPCLTLFLTLTLLSAAGEQPQPLRHPRSSAAPKAPASQPLSPRERALQLLNRFTFGPRPGDADHLLALGPDAPDKWLAQQLDPDHIPDAALNRRLADYPTLTMSPAQALALFPDRATIQQVAEGKRPAPSDPQLAAVYEVQVARYHRDVDTKATLPDGQPTHPELQLSDAQKADEKKAGQAAAARIAGELFALPKEQRMPALLALPVSDRIAFTTFLNGPLDPQRNLLLSQFTPHERELFNAMAANVGASYQIVSELQQAKLLRAVLSERQLQEVMTDFWFNHFNVDSRKDSDQWYTTSYERDAIRKHALGHFRDLLLATAQSPAMLVYLDNWLSIGPDSLANGVNPANPKSKRGNRGLNENYGREVMELHTVGVNGGYTQADVTALSAILTGWTVDKPNLAGPFLFDPKRHQPGPKQWLGHTIGAGATAASPQPTDAGMQEGLEALTILARDPHTAHFIAFLLAQRFVADNPPPALVDRLAATYTSTDGDISAILLALAHSPEFNSRQFFRNKVKTPVEFIASAFRSTATDPVNPGALANTLRTMGMPLYQALPPTGYYITADQWMNSTALVDRLNFAYALTGNKFANQKFDSPRLLALGLLARPTIPAAPVTPTGSRQGSATPRALTIAATSPTPASATLAGPDLALHVLEETLIGADASPKTSQLIHQQAEALATPSTSPTDSLNLLTALILGSPDFQLH